MCEAVDVKSPRNTPGACSNTGAFGTLECDAEALDALDGKFVKGFCRIECDPTTAWGNCEAFVSYHSV
jgi:hypothetical protein